jgi:uncharacterized cofD-like protein
MVQTQKKKKADKKSGATEGAAKRVVVIGGGTGTYTVLSALKAYDLDLTAIVTMADDGGSTGILRDEFGVLPPGDLRQCLVALSDAPEIMRKLFSHRFDRGGMKGHSFGNIFLSTLERITGNLDRAIDVVGEVLNIRGRVVPVTLDNVSLVATLRNGKKIHGEAALADYQLVSRFGIKDITLAPLAKANPKALRAIKEADVIIVGPGNLYCSLIPNFLVKGVSDALIKSKAQKVYVVNLMNKYGHTDDFRVADYVDAAEKIIGAKVFGTVLYNTEKPDPQSMKKYADEGLPVTFMKDHRLKERKVLGADLLSGATYRQKKGDLLRRTFIRHDIKKLGRSITELLGL